MSITSSIVALGRPVAFYPAIARAFGDINAALIVCQFMYWRGRVGEREIYKTQAEIEKETFVPAHTQRRVLKKLSDLGMVTVEKKGIPARNHFEWHWDVVDTFVSDYILQSQQGVTTSDDKLSRLDMTDCHDNTEQTVTTNTEITTETTTESLAQAAVATMPAVGELVPADDPVQPKVEIPADMPGPKDPKAKTFKTWANYAITYRRRYNAWPVWNARVAGQISNLIDRIGHDAAPKVAAYYLSISDQRFITEQHSVGMLLNRAEALHTQWVTGTRVNSTTARQNERSAANFEAAQTAIGRLTGEAPAAGGSIYDNPFYVR